MLERIDRHMRLMHRMAQATGTDLGEALLAGSLGAEGLRAAVLRCASCREAGACEAWLDAQGTAEGPVPAPGYCRNRGLLAGLAAV